MSCAAHSCPDPNCSQPRRKGPTVQLLLRVSRFSLPQKAYYLRRNQRLPLHRLLPASLHRLLPASRKKKGRMHCFLLQPAKRQPSLNDFRRRMVCAAHSCPGMNCSQPRRKGATVRLLLRVNRISLPLKDYCKPPHGSRTQTDFK